MWSLPNPFSIIFTTTTAPAPQELRITATPIPIPPPPRPLTHTQRLFLDEIRLMENIHQSQAEVIRTQEGTLNGRNSRISVLEETVHSQYEVIMALEERILQLEESAGPAQVHSVPVSIGNTGASEVSGEKTEPMHTHLSERSIASRRRPATEDVLRLRKDSGSKHKPHLEGVVVGRKRSREDDKSKEASTSSGSRITTESIRRDSTGPEMATTHIRELIAKASTPHPSTPGLSLASSIPTTFITTPSNSCTSRTSNSNSVTHEESDTKDHTRKRRRLALTASETR